MSAAARIQRPLRQAVVVLVLACASLWLAAGTALAVPLPPTDPPSPPVPIPVPTEDPAPEPDPDPPPPQPEPDPSPQPDPQPTSPAAGEPAPEPSPAPSGGLPLPVPGSSGDFVVPQGPTPVGPGGVPSFGVDAPQVAPPSGAAGGPAATGGFLLVTTPDALPGAIGGVFVLALMTVLGGVGSGFTTFSLTNRGALVARTLTGEIDMDRTRRVRTMLGVVLLGIAGLIGIVGYLRISVETLVPVQIVYLASAGFGVVIFGIAGGSLLVAETLRSDEGRVRELEAAVTTLARHMAGDVQDPPRLLDRTPAGVPRASADTPADAAPGAVAMDDPDDTADEPAGDDATTRVRTVRRVVRRDDE